eukprot:6210000-Pleurochrysis_carterae.AAC.3
MDLCYYESPPGIQLLHCLANDAVVGGGDSFLIDAFRVAENLRASHPHAFDVLARIPATFIKDHARREQPVTRRTRRMSAFHIDMPILIPSCFGLSRTSSSAHARTHSRCTPALTMYCHQTLSRLRTFCFQSSPRHLLHVKQATCPAHHVDALTPHLARSQLCA